MLLPGFQADTQLADPIANHLAPLVRKLTYGLLIVCLVLLPVYLTVAALGMRIGWMLVISACILIPVLLLTLWLLHQHRFQAGVIALTGGIILPSTLVLLVTGMQGPPIFLGLLAPIIFVGPLIGRRGRIIVTLISILITVLITVLNRPMPLIPVQFNSYDVEVIISLCIMLLLAFFGDQTSVLLRTALVTSIARERALADLNNRLEVQVAERTSTLQDTLKVVEQREQHLAGTLKELQSSQATVQQLSAPIIPVLKGVLVAPLIGTFDTARITVFIESVLSAVEQQRARHVAFDLTGAVITQPIAQELMHAANTVQLLGAQVVLVGLRPEIAEVIVASGIDLGRIATYPDLQAALIPLMPTETSPKPRMSHV